MNPYIVTLELNETLAAELTRWRQRYFPPERNFLDAHVTLFHALPFEKLDAVRADLDSVARARTAFEVRVPTCYSLGRGVALEVLAPEIKPIRDELLARWLPDLGPQDRAGKIRPHVTVQNKVSGDVARRTLGEVTATWNADARGVARGLGLWEYLGGPWRHAESFAFG